MSFEMDENVQSVTIEILRSIQQSLAAVHERLDRLEGVVVKMRRDNAGALVLMRSAAGAFEERKGHAEARLETLEAMAKPGE
jgi:hypothetical protein